MKRCDCPTTPKNAFTLIELLVVLTIIAILVSIVVPVVAGIVDDAKAEKTRSVFRAWATQLHQYKEKYKFFPPCIVKEAQPFDLSNDQQCEDFLVALKGMELNQVDGT